LNHKPGAHAPGFFFGEDKEGVPTSDNRIIGNQHSIGNLAPVLLG